MRLLITLEKRRVMSEVFGLGEDGEYVQGFMEGFRIGFREGVRNDYESLEESATLRPREYFQGRCKCLFDEISMILEKNEELKNHETRKRIGENSDGDKENRLPES
jgi:hypothetical protein